MSVSWTTASYAPNQILPLCSAVTTRCNAGFLRRHSAEREGQCFCVAQKREVRAFVTGWNRVSSSQTHSRYWEDPDDGSSDGDDEEDEEAEENNVDFESDWEEEIAVVASVSTNERPQMDECDEKLVKEVEQLLTPEEREILQRSATPNLEKISTAKWSPVHTLAISGQISSIDKLLEQGVDIDAVDKDGLTALHVAILGNKLPVIAHLLRKCASPHVRDSDGATPLHYAVQVGLMQLVKLFLKYNVDVNVADNEGWTPLHVAAQTRSRDILKILLLNGADSSRRNKDGNTALDISFCYGKDFKSYDLATVLKVIPANRDF